MSVDTKAALARAEEAELRAKTKTSLRGGIACGGSRFLLALANDVRALVAEVERITQDVTTLRGIEKSRKDNPDGLVRGHDAAWWAAAWDIATSGKLDGYRALGATAAAAENRRDKALARAEEAEEEVERLKLKNGELRGHISRQETVMGRTEARVEALESEVERLRHENEGFEAADWYRGLTKDEREEARYYANLFETQRQRQVAEARVAALEAGIREMMAYHASESYIWAENQAPKGIHLSAMRQCQALLEPKPADPAKAPPGHEDCCGTATSRVRP